MAFNPIEHKIAQALSAFPRIKDGIKWMYQWVNRMVYKTNKEYSSSFNVKPVFNGPGNTFYGYYDRSPRHHKQDWILFHRTNSDTSSAPQCNSEIEVVLWDLKNQKELYSGTTRAYNWQQGSRLIWLDSESFIFNDFSNNELCSRIVDANTRIEKKRLPFPIYDAHQQKAVSLNFSRLMAFDSDYGYASVLISASDKSFNDEEDGIFYHDLDLGTSRLVIPYSRLALKTGAKFKNHQNWVNHLMISPNGERMMFIYRWLENGIKKDALFVANISGNELQCIVNEGMVSHCCWVGNDSVMGYFRTLEHGDCFHFVQLHDMKIKPLESTISAGFGDGHPTLNGNNLLFDSYPDRSGNQHLYLLDLAGGELTEAGAFFQPMKFYGSSRCDLHPRFSADGKTVFFDSTHSGRRQLYYFNLEGEI